jgi:hypothetical protein
MSIQDRIINLLKRHPNYFVGKVSSSYSLTIDQISKYQDLLLWGEAIFEISYDGMSSNTNIDWSVELLDKFKHKWEWGSISIHIIGEYIWFDGILEKYQEDIDWESLSYNSRIPWTEELLDKYHDKLDWSNISSNFGIIWTKELIRRYEDKLNFNNLSNNSSLPINNITINRQPHYSMSKIPSEEVIEFLERYEDRLDWDYLSIDWTKGLNQEQTDEIIDIVMKSITVLEWPKLDGPF